MTESLRTEQLTDELLLEHAIDRFGAQCETDWLKERGLANYTSYFLEHGYYIAEVPGNVVDRLKGYFTPDNAIAIRSDPDRADYINAKISADVATELNRRNVYYGAPDPTVVEALEEFFGSILDDIECQLGHCWQVANVRAWSVKPNVEYGANAWHCDGFSRYVRKFLIYLNPPNTDAGTTEITTRNGSVLNLEAETAACVLLDAAVLAHRGRSPKAGMRPIIEVSVVPARKSSVKCVFAGQHARVPLDIARDFAAEITPKRYVEAQRQGGLRSLTKTVGKVVSESRLKVKRSVKGTKTARKMPEVTNLAGRLNLGGGRKWKHRGWINLEGVAGPANPFPFWFGEAAVFPIPSSSIQLAYSSHCLEHLEDGTVERMLRETRRTLSAEGELILKLPDCEEVIRRWRAGDRRFFEETWRLDKVVHTWDAKGVPDSINARAAYIFCGFWNSAYGEHFDGRLSRKVHVPGAYNGPPVQADEMMAGLMALDSPHEISARLTQSVVETEGDYTFNHQNAWSRKEMQELLERCGFAVESFDDAEIIRRHADVPGVELMREISFYVRAVPARGA